MRVNFPAALPKISNQLFARIELLRRGLVAIKIADQTNADRDIVQIIAVDMATINLSSPAVSNFDLAVPSRGAVADNEMVGETVFHSSNMAMVVIENTRVALARTAVVHDDELPSPLHHSRMIDLVANRARKILIMFSKEVKWNQRETGRFFVTGFLHNHLRRLFRLAAAR